MRSVAVIPARYASSRFPGKPLAPILGRPMVLWVLERARRVRGLAEVVVATDDDRIARCVEEGGGRALLTSPSCPSGTDRVEEAARSLGADVVVNLQGDEPALDPHAVERLLTLMEEDPQLPMGTLATPAGSLAEYGDPNVVKVVLGEGGRCLYFSRSPVPHFREGAPDLARVFRHVGVYAFRRDFLARFTSWPVGELEKAEKLEQLRALERGVPIRAAVVSWRGPSVDTPCDLAAAEAWLRAEEER
ncbi:MAG: 3-deoxy-manno-octulosonate cytidylyltransferase [Acidobacteriota bacterium]